jgi:hypothetical protein
MQSQISATSSRKISFSGSTPWAFIQYQVPGRLNIQFWKKGLASTLSAPSDASQLEKKFVIGNKLSYESCYLDLYVLNKLALQQFTLTCSDTCYVTYNSKNLNIGDVQITGATVELNAIELTADALEIKV